MSLLGIIAQCGRTIRSAPAPDQNGTKNQERQPACGHASERPKDHWTGPIFDHPPIFHLDHVPSVGHGIASSNSLAEGKERTDGQTEYAAHGERNYGRDRSVTKACDE